MRKKWMIVFVLMLTFLVACGSNDAATGEEIEATGEETTRLELPENMSYADLPKGVAITVDGDEIMEEDVDILYNFYVTRTIKQSFPGADESILDEMTPQGITYGEQLRHMVNQRLILIHLMQKELGIEKVEEEDVDKILDLIKSRQGGRELEDFLEFMEMTEEEYRPILEHAVIEDKYKMDYFSKNPVSDDQARAVYITRKDELTQYKASHILVETEEEAEEVLKKLDEGEEFAALAKEYSLDPGSKDNGGDLGYQPAQIYVPEFAEALINLEVGETSKPVESQFDIILSTWTM